jgi:CRISPR-associated endonuclease/helicase Cas3
MHREYKNKFPELKVTKLNREELDKLNAKGPARWDALFQIITGNDVIITNPDLLNFAMFGGYARHRGQHEVTQLFARVAYFVFDEYHLYDEEQIANIISWIIFAKTMVKDETKFIFASATAEMGLVEVLRQQSFEPCEIVERISDEQTATVRPIHGKIEVTFLKGTTPQDYLLQNAELIREWMQAGKRVLVIFDRMVDLRKARSSIEREFEDVAIAEESGYFTKSKVKEDTTSAQLILATNKVEVGVNLDVTVCLMQPGKHFANFVQRFGRVAREGKDGKVIVFLGDKIKPVEKAFASISSISYYDFIEKCRKIELLSERNFYSEKVPQYLGIYFYIISNSLKDFNTRKLFNHNLQLKGKAKYMYSLMRKIDRGVRWNLKKANESCGLGYQHDYDCWKKWWDIFTGTFKYFRASTPIVLVQDLDYRDGQQMIRYSLEWILKNWEVITIKQVDDEKCFVVSGYLDGNNELQYCVGSMPINELSVETMYLRQDRRYRVDIAFEESLDHIASQFYRDGDVFRRTARPLLENVRSLKPIFTDKRLAIIDIVSFSNII